MKRALIFGISGQDGAYLARLLLSKGYDVHGTSRDADLQSFTRLDALGVRERVTAHSVSLRDFRELLQIVTARVDTRLAEYIFDRLLDLQIDYFERHPVGAIAHDIREADKIKEEQAHEE